jgi:transcription-repair coupling factor (superfamily II helicase)
MLERAVRQLRANGDQAAADTPLAAVSEVELHVPALLPESYVPDMHLRLALYQRIAAADALQLRELGVELVDRFGPLPDAGSHLLRLAQLRLDARALGVRRLELGPEGGSVAFEAVNRADPAAVLQLVQRQPHDYRFDGPLKLRILQDLETPAERFEFARELLGRLQNAGPDSRPAAPQRRGADKMRR